MFIKHGVHIDAVNCQGLKASELSPIRKNFCFNKKCLNLHFIYLGDIIDFLRHEEINQMSLQCITSRYIGQNKIPYKGIIPKHLVSFVELHCATKFKQKEQNNNSTSEDLT